MSEKKNSFWNEVLSNFSKCLIYMHVLIENIFSVINHFFLSLLWIVERVGDKWKNEEKKNELKREREREQTTATAKFKRRNEQGKHTKISH